MYLYSSSMCWSSCCGLDMDGGMESWESRDDREMSWESNDDRDTICDSKEERERSCDSREDREMSSVRLASSRRTES